MDFNIECEQEEDGRWLAEVLEIPGVMAYGDTAQKAMVKAEALALRVIAERLENRHYQKPISVIFRLRYSSALPYHWQNGSYRYAPIYRICPGRG